MSQRLTAIVAQAACPTRRRALGLLLPACLPLPALAKGGGRGTLRLYRANGRYAGRIEPNGRHYDAAGRYVGRVEGQRLYDASGRYLGRFEESGLFRDSDEAPAQAPLAGASAPARDDPPPPPRPGKDVIRIVPDTGSH